MPKPDLSYLTDDPALSGMPANLAATANQNLAREDATVQRFNDVSRNIGAPASPEDIAAANAPPPPEPTLDPYIKNRHEALKYALQSGVDPDDPSKPLDAKSHARVQNEYFDTTELIHKDTMENVARQHEHLLQQKDIATANAVQGLIAGIGSIKSKPGDPQYEQELTQHITDNVGALDSTQGRNLIKMFATEHKTAQHRNDVLAAAKAKQPITYATIEDARKDFPDAPLKQTASGFVPEPVVIQPDKVIAEKNIKQAEDEIRKIHKLSPSEFLNGVVTYGNIEDKDGKRTFVSDTESKTTGGKIAQIDAGSKKLTTLSADEYYRLKTALDGQARPNQFDTEEAARTAGHAKGDIVVLKNPKTGKYQKARLD